MTDYKDENGVVWWIVEPDARLKRNLKKAFRCVAYLLVLYGLVYLGR